MSSNPFSVGDSGPRALTCWLASLTVVAALFAHPLARGEDSQAHLQIELGDHSGAVRRIAVAEKHDLLVTGASAVSTHGIRFGKGHGYFDLEWAMFSEIHCLADDPLVVCAVHDCQVVDLNLLRQRHAS